MKEIVGQVGHAGQYNPASRREIVWRDFMQQRRLSTVKCAPAAFVSGLNSWRKMPRIQLDCPI